MALTVSDSVVRLTGADVDVSAPHGGVRHGLRSALQDVRLERTRRGGVAVVREVEAEPGGAPGLVSLRRAGELLAESFLPAPVAEALRGLLERATRDFVALRIGVDAPGLAALPWEALPDPVDGLPLALHPHVIVYRRSALTTPARLAGPLRIVVAIASPDTGGGPLLDYEHELRAVLAAVRQARRYDARVEVVPFATTRAIRAALDLPGGAHVLHISAHGKPGALLLENEDGTAREVTAEELIAEAIPPGKMPPVLALAACYTDVDGEQQGTSFAAQLAARGVCAVIGTQTSVTDRYATMLLAQVYAELACSGDPDVVRAVSEARRLVQQTLLAGGDRVLAAMDEWGVVTLLANAPSIPVIDLRLPLQPVPAPRAAEWGRVAARPVGQFVGRRTLQRRLPALLAGDEQAGLVLHGIGGVGKTTLAAEVLRRTVEADPSWRVASLYGPLTADAVLAEVAAVARRELLLRQTVAGPATVAAQTAARIDVPWADRLALLHDHVLHEIPILLVLDNFEDNLAPDTHVLTDPGLAGLLAAWVSAPARSRVLVTSRHPFAQPDSAQLLAVPVGPLSAAETGKLLWSLPHVDRHATSAAVTERVWRAVGGHPRSLEYLDALLGQGQARFDDITDRLTKAVATRLGPEDSAAWLAQERTLDAALADTVTLAADDVLLADHLRHLATVPGAVELLMAISVYREPVPVGALHLDADVLVTLVRSSLVHQDPVGDLVFMHRWTATELHRYSGTATDSLLRAHRAAARHWLDLGEDLHDLTEARFHLLAAGDLDAADKVTATLCTQLENTGAWDRATALIHDTLRWLPPEAGNYPGYLHQLGTLAHHRGDYTEAERRYRQSVAVREPRGDQVGAAVSYYQIAILAYHRGDYTEAERRYRLALTVFEQANDLERVGSVHHQLGVLAEAKGDLDEAGRQYYQALDIFERLSKQARLADTYGQLGSLAHHHGDFDEAERRYRQALDLTEPLGDLAGVAITTHQLGMLAHDQGDLDEAERRYLHAVTLLERLGHLAGVVATYHQLGLLARARGDHTEAERRYRQSLAIEQQLGNRAGIATSLSQLGNMYAETDRPYEAVEFHIQAAVIRVAIGKSDAARSFQRLVRLRPVVGEDTFAGIAARLLGQDGRDNLIEVLDSLVKEEA
ncbi:hypothetical protein GCM10022255_038010 [Dactylosporangium darangshiense]|uniref:CHAT domain-containing protein n=1 Tax=Dactylosporangium darangshiense TaxID=579108 RepID=A0ABP8D952_9ACTN